MQPSEFLPYDVDGRKEFVFILVGCSYFPNVQPDLVRYHNGEWHYTLYEAPLEVSLAALLILGGIVEGVPTISFINVKDGRKTVMIGRQIIADADTFTEAACIALHRYGDSKELG